MVLSGRPTEKKKEDKEKLQHVSINKHREKRLLNSRNLEASIRKQRQHTCAPSYVIRAVVLGQRYASIIIIIIIIIIIYLLTARVVGAPQMISQPFSSIFPCSPLSSGTCELQACPFPDVVFPPLPLSALSSFPFHPALQDGFGQT